MAQVMRSSPPGPPATAGSPAIAILAAPARSPTHAASSSSSSSPAPSLSPSSPTPSLPSTASEASTPVNHVHHPSNVIPAYPYNVSQLPQGHNGPAPDDLGITTRLPSICVDYLSHDWAEDDVWTSWKAMTRHKSEIANGVRLENASWRTWAKQRGNLKTISPETLNWLKDSDVTWLYGPLHTAVDAVPPPRVATASERLGLEPLRSLSDARADQAKAAKIAGSAAGAPKAAAPAGAKKAPHRKPAIASKPILKYRSLSDILLPPNTPASPVLESIDELDHAGAGLPSSRSAADLRRTNSTGGSRSQTHSPRGGSPERALTSDSSSSAASTTGRRHISFNHRVEQCIAVDSTEEAQKYPSAAASSSDDSDDGDDEDDVLTFRSSPRVANFGPNAMSPTHTRTRSGTEREREPHTIVWLGPTTLKSTELWPHPSPAVVYQEHPQTASEAASGKAAAVAVAAGDEQPGRNSYTQPVATYTTRPASQPAGGRRPYDYAGGIAGQMGSQWDPEDDDEDYAMGFDYFNGPDVMVGDEYDTAQYGSQHLVGTSHNNYQGGTTAGPPTAYISSSPASGSTPSSYNPYAPSPTHSSGNSTDSSPSHSRRSSANASVSSSPASPAPIRGPHAPVPSASAQPSKRSILKGQPPSRSRENSASADDVVSSSSSPSSLQGARFGAGSPIASPPGSGATSPQSRPTVRRAGSEEFRDRDREGRGRSASRGSSSSLERSASADRRSSLSPASSYVSLVQVGSSSGSRPIGIPGSRRGGSSDALNTLAGGMPGSRLMPDLPEASSESETETSKAAPGDDDDEAAVGVPQVESVNEPASPVIAHETLEDATLPSMTGALSVSPGAGKANGGRPPPIVFQPGEPSTLALDSSPPLVPGPVSAKATSEASPLAPAPRYRQPSPAKPASSTTTDEEAHAVDLQSLSNSPALTPADLASTPWSDESNAPSYARRSLLRAARSMSEDGTRPSVDNPRVQTDDYGFGYYDEEETSIVGRGLDVAGTARDIIGALSRGLWSVASGRR